jgi:molybdenum cofactor cytidylyltransferase
LRAEVGSGVEVVVNQDWAEGLAASIRCGLRALEAITAGTADACVLTLCDQPFVTSAVINRLVQAYEIGGRLLVASEYAINNEPTQGVPALFSRALFAELIDLRGAAGAQRIIKRHRAEAAFVAVPEAAFDVDTPADYRSLTNNADAPAGAGLDVV